MKITDYPPVDLLTDNDVILIDGNNGTKKLLVGGDISKMTSSFDSSDNASETGIITSAGGETAISTLESKATFSRLFNKMSRSFLNTRKLINTVKRIWATVATSWASGETYAVGDVRLWTNGHTYICKLAHTSSSSITPANTTYWEDKTLGDMISSLNSNYTKLSTWTLFQTFAGNVESNAIPNDCIDCIVYVGYNSIDFAVPIILAKTDNATPLQYRAGLMYNGSLGAGIDVEHNHVTRKIKLVNFYTNTNSVSLNSVTMQIYTR